MLLHVACLHRTRAWALGDGTGVTGTCPPPAVLPATPPDLGRQSAYQAPPLQQAVAETVLPACRHARRLATTWTGRIQPCPALACGPVAGNVATARLLARLVQPLQAQWRSPVRCHAGQLVVAGALHAASGPRRPRAAGQRPQQSVPVRSTPSAPPPRLLSAVKFSRSSPARR